MERQIMSSDPEWDRMSDKAKAKYIEILRAIPIGRRFEITIELCNTVQELMAAGIRDMHPGISEEDVRKEIIRRTVPEDLRKKVYGW
jgi:methionine aminopeptidase